MREEDLREAFTDWLRPVREAEPPDMPVIRRRMRRHRGRMAAAFAAAAVGAAVIVVTVHPTGAAPHGTASPQPGVRTATSTVSAATSRPSPIQGGYQVSSSYTVSSPVRTLIVSGGLGGINIAGSQRSTVSVTEQLRYSTTPPVMTRSLTGGTLRLGYTCPNQTMCSASFDIQVPGGITVMAANGDGSINLSSLAGPVKATSGLGSITATGLTSATADFSSGNGEIGVAFAAAPVKVSAATAMGVINIRVPTTVSYNVITNAGGLGTATVTVPEASSSPHRISATTSMGVITIAPAGS
jgi:hypothetical protein